MKRSGRRPEPRVADGQSPEWQTARAQSGRRRAVRIAIVTETFLPQANGTVCMLLEFLTYLQTHGHEAIVFGPGDGERPYRGVEIAPVHGAPLPLYPELILVPHSTLVGSTLRAWRPDFVHLAGPVVLGDHFKRYTAL